MLTAEKEFETALGRLGANGRQYEKVTALRPVYEELDRIIEEMGYSTEKECGGVRDTIDNIAYLRFCNDLAFLEKTNEYRKVTRNRLSNILPFFVKRADDLSKGMEATKYVMLNYGYFTIIKDFKTLERSRFILKITNECNEICKTDRRE